MKNYLIIISAAVLFINLPGCNKETLVEVRALDEKIDAKTIELIIQNHDTGIPFPEGSTATKMADGRVKITLPEGYKFLMTDPRTGNIIGGDGSETGVTCNCTTGTGCSPVKYNGKYHCVIENNCKTCTKLTSLIDGTPVRIDGVYQPDKAITMVSKEQQEGFASELTSLRSELIGSAFPALFKLEDVKNQLFEIYHFIYGEQIPEFILKNEPIAPSGYQYIAINIFGNEAAIPMPIDKIGNSEYIVAASGGVNCKCNDTTPKGCNLHSTFGAKYCSSDGCKSCSLLD
jgi:hypothetical protein